MAPQTVSTERRRVLETVKGAIKYGYAFGFQIVSVIVNGTYEELREPQNSVESEHARQLLEKRHRWWSNALAERRARGNDLLIDPLFFRIHTVSMTGLRAVAEGEAAGGS